MEPISYGPHTAREILTNMGISPPDGRVASIEKGKSSLDEETAARLLILVRLQSWLN